MNEIENLHDGVREAAGELIYQCVFCKLLPFKADFIINPLMVQNLANKVDDLIQGCWYLANDMQYQRNQHSCLDKESMTCFTI